MSGEGNIVSYQVPEILKYTKEHEWIKVDGDEATVGITDYAQSSLGDVVFVEFPDVGQIFQKGESFGVVESIKSVSDLYAPVSGEILEVNDELESSPEFCNQAPYNYWIIKIKWADDSEFSSLLSPQDYSKFCQEQLEEE